MISGVRPCNNCGGAEHHIIPTNAEGNPSGPDTWQCEQCGQVRNHYGVIITRGRRGSTEVV